MGRALKVVTKLFKKFVGDVPVPKVPRTTAARPPPGGYRPPPPVKQTGTLDLAPDVLVKQPGKLDLISDIPSNVVKQPGSRDLFPSTASGPASGFDELAQEGLFPTTKRQFIEATPTLQAGAAVGTIVSGVGAATTIAINLGTLFEGDVADVQPFDTQGSGEGEQVDPEAAAQELAAEGGMPIEEARQEINKVVQQIEAGRRAVGGDCYAQCAKNDQALEAQCKALNAEYEQRMKKLGCSGTKCTSQRLGKVCTMKGNQRKRPRGSDCGY